MSLEYEAFFKTKCQASVGMHIDPINLFFMSVEGAHFCSEDKHVKTMVI